MAKARRGESVASVTADIAGAGSTVTLQVPVRTPGENGYQSQVRVHDQLHVSSLQPSQRRAMRDVFCGLREKNVELDGKPIANQNDAIRWLLDAIANAQVASSA